VRVSGPLAADVARAVTGALPQPRHAALARFRAADGAVIDEGIALYFAAPHSYTGEDVLELQGHGGPVVMQALLARAVELGARIAEPGEFTRRAFLNDRLDLAQAESVADLIDAASLEAARSAARSLTGEFSARIHELVAGLTDLRTHVEACIDFPEDEIDPADRAAQRRKLDVIGAQLEGVLGDARQGAVLREGLTAVLIGRPNVGKSSLLNRLAGDEVAIVTPIAGTTRDSVRVTIHLSGVPIHLVDTAGLRDAADEIERLGIERTWRAVEAAGAALFVTEPGRPLDADELAYLRKLPPHVTVARVVNKIDLAAEAGPDGDGTEAPIVRVSAKTGAGIESLRAWLLEVSGWKPHGEGAFMARQRHLDALQAAAAHVSEAEKQAQVFELMAEELRLAQAQLGRITGEVTADDVLGAIFARFCIGK